MPDQLVEVLSEPLPVDARCPGEGRDGTFGRHEEAITERDELADGHAVAAHHERLSSVQGAHDLAALVAKLSLGDLPAHGATVARVLQPVKGPLLRLAAARLGRVGFGILGDQPGR